MNKGALIFKASRYPLFICRAFLSISLRWNLKQLCPALREYCTFCPHQGHTIYRFASSFLEECMLFRAIIPLFLHHPYPPLGTLSASFMDRCTNNMCIIGGVFKVRDRENLDCFDIQGRYARCWNERKARVCGLGFSTAELVQNRWSQVGRCSILLFPYCLFLFLPYLFQAEMISPEV